jgi:hypothetical protein
MIASVMKFMMKLTEHRQLHQKTESCQDDLSLSHTHTYDEPFELLQYNTDPATYIQNMMHVLVQKMQECNMRTCNSYNCLVVDCLAPVAWQQLLNNKHQDRLQQVNSAQDSL